LRDGVSLTTIQVTPAATPTIKITYPTKARRLRTVDTGYLE